MKKLIFLAVLLGASVSLARPNILCFYISGPQGWMTSYLYSYIEFAGKRSMGTVSASIGEIATNETFCSRDTEYTTDTGSIFDQGHFIIEAGGEQPDPFTCEFPATTSYRTIKRQKSVLAPGEFAEIANKTTKLKHYVMTDAELLAMDSADAAKVDELVANKCIELEPGSTLAEDPAQLLRRLQVHPKYH